MELGDGEVHDQPRTLPRRDVEPLIGHLMGQGHVRVKGEAERAGQRAAAVADPGLKAVALLGAAAQTEVDHRTDGAEGADLVETHV